MLILYTIALGPSVSVAFNLTPTGRITVPPSSTVTVIDEVSEKTGLLLYCNVFTVCETSIALPKESKIEFAAGRISKNSSPFTVPVAESTML